MECSVILPGVANTVLSRGLHSGGITDLREFRMSSNYPVGLTITLTTRRNIPASSRLRRIQWMLVGIDVEGTRDVQWKCGFAQLSPGPARR